MASPSAGAPVLKYGDVNIVTPSPGEVKGLMDYVPINVAKTQIIYMNIMENALIIVIRDL